jgi:CBS-domain-containing membrane protein
MQRANDTSQKSYFTCERWMTRRVWTVKPRDSVARAFAILKKYRINQLPVIDNRKIVGIITDRDLRNAATISAMFVGIMESERPVRLSVEAVMTRKVLTLNCQSSLLSAAELLRRRRIGAEPITDDNSLVGIITRSDILDAFIAREAGGPRLKRRSLRLRFGQVGSVNGRDFNAIIRDRQTAVKKDDYYPEAPTIEENRDPRQLLLA